MTAWRVTMTPGTSDWARDDLRWAAGFHKGLWQEFATPDAAAEQAQAVTALGWAAEVQPIEETAG